MPLASAPLYKWARSGPAQAARQNLRGFSHREVGGGEGNAEGGCQITVGWRGERGREEAGKGERGWGSQGRGRISERRK